MPSEPAASAAVGPLAMPVIRWERWIETAQHPWSLTVGYEPGADPWCAWIDDGILVTGLPSAAEATGPSLAAAWRAAWDALLTKQQGVPHAD